VHGTNANMRRYMLCGGVAACPNLNLNITLARL